MLSTPIGYLDGDKWEEICQICLKQKFEKDNYQEIPASPGDYGIEGYNNKGDVFQCYCPDENYNPDELLKKQKSKVRDDLKKLIKYSDELLNLFGGAKIKRWIFLTPIFNRKELLEYCQQKVLEYKSKGLEILDDNFVVLVQDYQFLSEYIPVALGITMHKIELDTTKIELENSEKFVDLITRIKEKQTKRLDLDPNNIQEADDERLNILTTRAIESYFRGEDLLKKLEDLNQNEYERFIRVVTQIELDVEEKCLAPNTTNINIYNEIKNDVKERLAREFPMISESTIAYLTNRVIADWLVRCPLNFN